MRNIMLRILIAGFAIVCYSQLAIADVPLFKVFETTVVNTNSYSNKFFDVELEAEFTSPSGTKTLWRGFYDGDGNGGGDSQTGNVWRLRFMPDEVGTWHYTYTWTDGTPGDSGSFDCVSDGAGRGVIRAYQDNPHWFAYNGTEPVFIKSYQLYYEGLLHHDIDWTVNHVYQKMVDAGYNHLQIYLLPTSWYESKAWKFADAPATVSHDHLFSGVNPSGTMNLRVCHNLDKHVTWLNNHNIGLLGHQGFDGNAAGPRFHNLSSSEQEFYVKYVCARLAPYANICGWNYTWETRGDGPELIWADLIMKYDPWSHLRSYHDQWPDSGPDGHAGHHFADPRYSLANIENHTQDHTHPRSHDPSTHHLVTLSAYAKKPVFMSEGNGLWRWFWGAKENEIHRNAWAVTTAGGSFCWTDHTEGGSSATIFSWSDVKDRIDYLSQIMTQDLRFYRMDPHDELLSSVTSGATCYCLAEIGKQYMVYKEEGGGFDLSLAAGTYTATWIDTRTNDRHSAGDVTGAGSHVNFISPDNRTEWLLLLLNSQTPAQSNPPRSVSETPVVGPRASGFSTGKDGEAGDIGAYRRYSRTQSSRKTSRSKPDRILRQAPIPGSLDSDKNDPRSKDAIMPAMTSPHLSNETYYHETRYVGKDISEMVSKLPFAYYPSINKLEVALLRPEDLPADTRVTRAIVKVLAIPSDRVVAEGTIPLNSEGRGQAIIGLPDLPDGEYAVEYGFGTLRIRSPKTFKRIHFPWENNTLGVSHKVWPPFTPVEVQGKSVNIVDRTYRLNGFGLLDSVVSQGKELLAGPMRVVCETTEGRATWNFGHVHGVVRHDDQAIFDCNATCSAVTIRSTVEVEEDGCAILRMHLSAGDRPTRINRMWIEIPMKDIETPLFHFAAANGMRLNYGGSTPRGHDIRWDLETQGWRPSLWSSSPGTDDPVVWDSTQVKLWHNEKYGYCRPFVPYIYLGGVERGLAWLGETDRGYVVDGKQPVQVLRREPGKVILDINLIQGPYMFDKGEQRTLVFGLQASPTKPMETAWRTRTINHGVGCVVCWGGYVCASKYPDNRDFEIVDKIQEARRTGKVDTDWFVARDQAREHPDRKCFDRQPWLENILDFAENAAHPGKYPSCSGCYFEEHAIDTREQEWEVFQDEWSMRDFARFQDKPSNWGVSRQSYQDFALYYANEFMKRGVSLYFDNTNIKDSFNRRFSNADTDANGTLRWASEIFGARRYYKRIWKLAQAWNTRGVEYPIDVTFHMTNTDELPFATWCSAVLELEQASFTDSDGLHIPWSPDYVQAVLMNRRAGAVTIALDTLTGDPRNEFEKHPPEVRIAHWAMCRIHGNIRRYHDWYQEYSEYDKILLDFGFGTSEVTDTYYWGPEPSVRVANETVVWMFLKRKQQPSGLLVLQSYRANGTLTKVTIPDAVRFRDCKSGQTLTALDSSVEIDMPGRYATRVFYVETQESGVIP